MNSIVIQERMCPRCRIRRTVRLGCSTLSLCFNCHLQFGSGPTSGLALPQPAAYPAYPFSDRELARLQTYRAAVHSGFYSDRAVDRAQFRHRN